MDKKDVIIGSAAGYEWSQLECWARSLRGCGFTGDAYLIYYDSDPDVVARLEDLDIQVFRPAPNHLGVQTDDVVVDRFYQKWVLLRQVGLEKAHRVISSDVQDVVFQSNPFDWLDAHLTQTRIFLTSEGISYKDETWGRENFKSCFGEMIWTQGMAARSIYNCGVWGGRAEFAADLFLLIYLIGFGHPKHSLGQRPGQRWTDQATLNLLSQLNIFRESIDFIASEDGFAAQLGTFYAQSEAYANMLNEPRPKFVDGEVFTASGKKFAIVHQYNRVPELCAVLQRRYRSQ